MMAPLGGHVTWGRAPRAPGIGWQPVIALAELIDTRQPAGAEAEHTNSDEQ